MTNGKRVSLGHIIAADRTEIVEHQERRSPCSLGRKQRGLVARARERLAIYPDDTELLPLTDRFQRVLADAVGIEAIGQLDFVTPGLPGLPFRHFEIACRRRERIGDVGPDVALAVAIVVGGVRRICGRNELRVPHGAGPGAVHGFERHIAALHDLQRRIDLRPGVFGLGSGADQGGERMDHILVAGLLAVIRLNPPNGHEDVAVDPVACLKRIEQGLILHKLFLAFLQPLGGDGPVDIFADRLDVFRLISGGLDHFGVGLKSLEGAIERGAGDARSLGRRPQALHAFGAIGFLGAEDRS